MLAAPAGPLGSFPVQQLRPGSAFGVGYASGDIAASAIGTVTYTDGDNVWGFGHPLDGVGARSLLLQDAYVFRVINNPIAIGESAGHVQVRRGGARRRHARPTTRWTPSSGGSARCRRRSRCASSPPTSIRAPERTVATNVADETAVDQPTGGSILSFLAPLAVTQAAGTVLGGSPARLTGRACFAISFKEASKPVRFCNRYVSDVAGRARRRQRRGGDREHATCSRRSPLVDSFKAGEVHVTGVDADVEIARGQRQAFLRGVRLPRRARAGQKVDATLRLRHVRGPRGAAQGQAPPAARPAARQAPPGLHAASTSTSAGATCSTSSTSASSPAARPASSGRRTSRRLFAQIDDLARYDGISAGRPSSDPEDFDPGVPSYRDPDLRISGSARATIRIKKR